MRGSVEFILFTVIALCLCSGIILYRGVRGWYILLLDSRNSRVDLTLYFGMVALFSVFLYTAYAVLIRHFEFVASDFGRGIGITFLGVGLSWVGTGLEYTVDGDHNYDDHLHLLNTQLSLRGILGRVANADDARAEMHLLLGALAIIFMILYTGYNLAYQAHGFDPSNYGEGLAYTFTGVGVAGWGQGLQRKLRSKGESS